MYEPAFVIKISMTASMQSFSALANPGSPGSSRFAAPVRLPTTFEREPTDIEILQNMRGERLSVAAVTWRLKPPDPRELA